MSKSKEVSQELTDVATAYALAQDRVKRADAVYKEATSKLGQATGELKQADAALEKARTDLMKVAAGMPIATVPVSTSMLDSTSMWPNSRPKSASERYAERAKAHPHTQG